MIATKYLWLLGFSRQAVQRGHLAIQFARQIEHLFSLVVALNNVATMFSYCQEYSIVIALMTESIEISRQQHYSVLVAEAHIFRGWAYAMQGEIELGLAELRQGMDEWNALGNVLNQSHHQILLAEVYLAAHDPTAALASAERAIAASRVEGYLEPEAHRLRGEALLKLGAPAAHAEESFQQALTVARRQQACSLELRASMSLARLWQSQGKHAEAHELLSAIYGWFSEGFDTPDLIEAKALLAALAREYDRQATAISGGLDQMCYNCG